MPSILNSSLTGMLAFQRGLAVTSHNIANANTPGYSRQVVEYSSRVGTGVGNTYIGGGTQVASIKRNYDHLLAQQLQSTTTGQARFSALDDLASRLDRLLADPNTGLSSGLQNFFGAVQDVANDPASIPARQALLGEASSIAGRFQSLDKRFEEIGSEVNSRLRVAVDDINRLASSVAEINQQIAVAGGTDRAPLDLLDERDRLILDLSGKVAVTTTLQGDGTMSVFIGSGQTLVVGSDVQELAVQRSEFDPTELNVVYQGAAGSAPLDRSLTGGALGGLLEFRGSVLDPARRSLGQTATGLAVQFNTQHASGMDLRGALGGDFFSISPPAVRYSANNTGTGNVVAAVGDLAALTGDDYLLSYDGTNYSLSNQTSATVVPMSGNGTVGNPFVADGLEFIVSGTPAAGDTILVRSTFGTAGSVRNLVSDPKAISMAAPVRSSASLENLGAASISATTVADATHPDLLNASLIEFTGPSTYSINGSGSFAYTDGTPIVINGTELTITGAPVAGDRFSIEANFGASGDNGNGLMLAGVQSVGIFDGGTVGINENHGQLIAAVGSMTHQIQSNREAQDVLLRNAEEAMLSKSAVNLDEEAARLMQYQQAYQAVAQVVAIANSLFDSLLYATRR
ncbi:MAG TPA: flagellar hook-associated protein FlgK [Woeseiaceae bacterium]|nr:flagellar hook-associated protein FlgK [Woeseiaceae bacterium]